MTAVEKMIQTTNKKWFVATYRIAVMTLIPLFGSLAIWVLVTVNSTQIAAGEFKITLEEVGKRVSSLEESNQNAIAERIRLDEDRNTETVSIATRLTRLETSNENLVKAIDRLVKLMDDNPPARRAP